MLELELDNKVWVSHSSLFGVKDVRRCLVKVNLAGKIGFAGKISKS
jgi:hypothetical protein